MLQDKEKIEQAKDVLRKAGYYVDNLWHINDVRIKFKNCSDKESYRIMDKLMTSDNVIGCIFEEMDDVVRGMDQEPNKHASTW